MIIAGLGLVAQLVEQRTFNPLVASSSLAQPTKNHAAHSDVSRFDLLRNSGVAPQFLI